MRERARARLGKLATFFCVRKAKKNWFETLTTNTRVFIIFLRKNAKEFCSCNKLWERNPWLKGLQKKEGGLSGRENHGSRKEISLRINVDDTVRRINSTPVYRCHSYTSTAIPFLHSFSQSDPHLLARRLCRPRKKARRCMASFRCATIWRHT